MPATCKIRVGTSGWHYKHWLGKFYPERLPPANMLAWYSREFGTVEINNSFYRLPTEEAFAVWRQTVPPGFLFSLKGSRFLTHMKRLRDPEQSIDLFFSRARHLKQSLGPVLFQLPPNWKADASRLEYFLNALPAGYRYVIEFRDASWNNQHIFDLLRSHKAALCLHDWGATEWPTEMTADFTYIRFHGFGAAYGGDYPEDTLRTWADRITNWERPLSAIFVYFNNDAHGFAISNARQLMKMLNVSSAAPVAA
jgi:uncharacterized protein YecE (DUF72 family)